MIGWALVLVLCGILLVVAEFIVPGWICGVFGMLLMCAGGYLGIQAMPEYTLPIILGELFALMGCVIVGMYMLSRGAAGKWLRLDTAQRAEEGWVNEPSDMSLIGREGVVFSALRPAGAIEIGGRRIDAVSDGAFIDKGARVRVIEVHGNRVVVEVPRGE